MNEINEYIPVNKRIYKCIGCGCNFTPQKKYSKYCNQDCYNKNVIMSENSIKNLRHDLPPKSRPWDGGKRPDMTGEKHPMFGKKHTEEAKAKIRAPRALQGPINQGENHGNWKGGISKLRIRLHMSLPHRKWVATVVKRDNRQCQHCGVKGSRKTPLEVHHIISFKDIRDKFNITTYEEAIACKELWDINNGLTLCKECHKKTDNYGNKKQQVA